MKKKDVWPLIFEIDEKLFAIEKKSIENKRPKEILKQYRLAKKELTRLKRGLYCFI